VARVHLAGPLGEAGGLERLAHGRQPRVAALGLRIGELLRGHQRREEGGKGQVRHGEPVADQVAARL